MAIAFLRVSGDIVDHKKDFYQREINVVTFCFMSFSTAKAGPCN